MPAGFSSKMAAEGEIVAYKTMLLCAIVLAMTCFTAIS
jgi:hypothetical protein